VRRTGLTGVTCEVQCLTGLTGHHHRSDRWSTVNSSVWGRKSLNWSSRLFTPPPSRRHQGPFRKSLGIIIFLFVQSRIKPQCVMLVRKQRVISYHIQNLLALLIIPLSLFSLMYGGLRQIQLVDINTMSALWMTIANLPRYTF
jgi:hypothetical protein